MAFEHHWKTERSFWLDGPEVCESHLAEAACMVFPAPVGILTGTAINESLAEAPRWSEVEFDEESETVSQDTVVLAYRATGQSGDDDPYTAYCSTTYVREGDAWKLLSHQQTPV
ncbi:DUF4440 domain-containing protein [Marinibacterium profundimaris]|uniref:DUF4440 domain-containing protein n=1 Tax=Marinibacterium profundimaris TaxID=1679460 RepID=A0A225NNQ7_9RHOB|nr:DUF4440 domain-containing protein [Marinibacterium profundimaris]OWU76055.1 hypothetical protein ATO3_07765 [Marinibacterium profundimaris]